jgi:uncharacterized membrane protein YvlD (DUF360 family)
MRTLLDRSGVSTHAEEDVEEAVTMTWFLIKMLIRAVVFGVAITYVTRKNSSVKVTPRSALPLVALVFAGLNTLLYWFVSGTMNVVTLGTMFFLVPFAANAALLWLTDKLFKPFKVDGLFALAYASLIVTLAHLLMRFVLP